MSVTAGLISGFDQARTKYRDAELLKAKQDQDREFSILSALAQHIDPELAKVGAAGMLNLAQGGAPRTGKGLKGFLGEVDASSHMPALQQLFGAGAPEAPSTAAVPTAGSAAQPNSAAVDPERVANGPGIGAGVTPPTMGGAPPTAAVGGVTAPTFGADAGNPLGEGAPPQMGMAGGMGMPPPGPPPPETPQARSRRLFPTAGEIAAEQASKTLQARIQAVFEGIRSAKTPDEVDIVRGLAGAPRRQSAGKIMNARYIDATTGEEVEGTVIFDGVAQTAEVNGQPVQVTKLLGANQPRPIGVNRNVGGVITRDFLNPNDPSAPPIASVETGMPVPPPPSEYSGTATVNGQVVRLPRGGGAPEVLGDAPQAAGALTPVQQEATAMLTDVNAEVKAKISQKNAGVPTVLGKTTALTVAEQNAIVQQTSKGRYKTMGELLAATKRQVGTGSNPSSGNPQRDLGNRVRQRLERGDPSTIQGSGMPPGM